MPYRRHLICPLLTTHGHILTLLQRNESLRRRDIAETLALSDDHVTRLLGELSGEGLISHERVSGSVWWRIAEGVDVVERMFSDRDADGTIVTVTKR